MSSVSSAAPIEGARTYKTCQNCGATYKANIKAAKYGDYCQAKECANVYRKVRQRITLGYKGGTEAELTCKRCGDVFIGWAGRLYCDKAVCKRRAKNSKPNQSLECSECGKSGVIARGLCPTHYSYWRRENVGRTAYMHDKVCAFCGKNFQAQTKRTAHCSSACGKRNLAGWSKSKEIVMWVAPRREPPAVIHVATARRITCGNCRVCGDQFTSIEAVVTCSAECAKARLSEIRNLSRDRRRARQRDAFVAPVYRKKVFEADGYRCHICRKLTKRDAVVPHPKAPTIDHLIPLSLGGTHEPSNCRTAHFLCNSVKGDRLAGDQLILFSA